MTLSETHTKLSAAQAGAEHLVSLLSSARHLARVHVEAGDDRRAPMIREAREELAVVAEALDAVEAL